jgi:hypothetical protein
MIFSFLFCGSCTYADVINRASGGKPVTVLVASNIIPERKQKKEREIEICEVRKNEILELANNRKAFLFACPFYSTGAYHFVQLLDSVLLV